MPTAWWRTFAIIFGIITLAFIAGESFDTRDNGEEHLGVERIPGEQSLARFRVRHIDGSARDHGDLRIGDIVTLHTNDLPGRLTFARGTIGVPTVWNVERDGKTFQTTTYTTPLKPADRIRLAVIEFVRACMVFIALVLAVRRPDRPEARALASFLIAFAFDISIGAPYLPDPLFLATAIAVFGIQWFSLAQALRFACIFPFESKSGVRRWLQRFTPPFAIVGALTTMVFVAQIMIAQRYFSFAPLNWFANWSSMYFFVAVTLAFIVAARQATGVDKQRVIWASSSLGNGFIGPLIAVVLIASHVHGEWIGLLPMTFVVIPIGLAYTILRHRTIDIGFVISRALVFAILSFIIVAAFGVLEWVLGKVVVEVSHLTSQSLELALAIGLGFSLRPIHHRIDQLVDNLFFRDRHRAAASLRRFARESTFITSVPTLLARTIAIVGADAQAGAVAVYVFDGTAYMRVAESDAAQFPPVVDENDPVFVRLRATRDAASFARLESAIVADQAFPMLVRGQLFGALICCAKSNSETYDPDEIRLLSDIAQAVGSTIDILHTEALKREIDRVLAEGGPLDELRSVRHRLPVATAIPEVALYDTIRSPG